MTQAHLRDELDPLEDVGLKLVLRDESAAEDDRGGLLAVSPFAHCHAVCDHFVDVVEDVCH